MILTWLGPLSCLALTNTKKNGVRFYFAPLEKRSPLWRTLRFMTSSLLLLCFVLEARNIQPPLIYQAFYQTLLVKTSSPQSENRSFQVAE